MDLVGDVEQDNLGSGLQECLCGGFADAAGSAGDDGASTRE
ncbi:hypothetical protein OAD57_02565 [Porticoccaceae bacterium]|nr:hypothetical protein [Porticoccaceae bacterium]